MRLSKSKTGTLDKVQRKKASSTSSTGEEEEEPKEVVAPFKGRQLPRTPPSRPESGQGEQVVFEVPKPPIVQTYSSKSGTIHLYNKN